MSLITPDGGLLFWMVIIFGLVFFILAKYGFPVITSMVEKRETHINESLKLAQQAEDKMKDMVKEHSKMIQEAREEQTKILKEASAAKDNLIAQAKVQAADEAAKIIAEAKTQITAEKESAMRDIRRQVALLSVSVAEKVIRKDLDNSQTDFVDKMVDEMSDKMDVKNN